MSKISIHKLIPNKNNDILVDGKWDIGFWKFKELGIGRHTIYYPEKTLLAILDGKGSVRCGKDSYKIFPKILITIEGGSNLVWDVKKSLQIREAKAKELENWETFDSIIYKIANAPPSSERGKFVLISNTAPLEYNNLDIVYTGIKYDVVFSSLFPIRRGVVNAYILNLSELCGFNLLSEPYKICANDITRLDNSLNLSFQEELIIRNADRWLKWIPDKKGSSLIKSLSNYFPKIMELTKELSSYPGPDPLFEQILEILLSTAWHTDNPKYIYEYMHTPISNPYPLDYLFLFSRRRLSEKFKRRWGIKSVCYGFSIADINKYALISVESGYSKKSLIHCTISFLNYHEYASWSYEIERKGNNLRVIKKTLDQWAD